jgi:hypothetical protein
VISCHRLPSHCAIRIFSSRCCLPQISKSLGLPLATSVHFTSLTGILQYLQLLVDHHSSSVSLAATTVLTATDCRVIIVCRRLCSCYGSRFLPIQYLPVPVVALPKTIRHLGFTSIRPRTPGLHVSPSSHIGFPSRHLTAPSSPVRHQAVHDRRCTVPDRQ